VRERLQRLSNRLEALSPRERVIALVGIPLVLAVMAEGLVFSPARSRTAEAGKQMVGLQAELGALKKVLESQPATPVLPAADQLIKQRNELQAQIDGARAVVASASQNVDWSTVVRDTVSGRPGLTLAQLRTLPPEQVFPVASRGGPNAAAAKPADPKASGPAAALAQAEKDMGNDVIYRHRCELTVKGDVDSLLAYVQGLQRLPGYLHWEKLHLAAAAYPQASVQLTLYTLSYRSDTPFN
jgi:MSHA biogenesis protein MshJ